MNGPKYLEYSERETKAKTGAKPRNVRAVTCKPKANGLPDRDPVFVYKVYSEKRPSLIKDSDSPFHLGINYTKNPTEKPWFNASPMGVNKLNSFMKTMANKAGFDEKPRITNHSAGLKIMAGQRTMSGLIEALTGQTFNLLVMLTGQNRT